MPTVPHTRARSDRRCAPSARFRSDECLHDLRARLPNRPLARVSRRPRRGSAVVVGAPLVPAPDETAESLHARYIDALVALHEKHKARYYEDDRVLVVK